MINKDVFSRTKVRLIKINMIVVAFFLVILMGTTFLYFRHITYNNIDDDITNELRHVIRSIDRFDAYNGAVTLNDPRDMVFIYEDGRIKYYTDNEYFDSLVPDGDNHGKEGFSKYVYNGYSFRELTVNMGNYKVQIIRNIDPEMGSIKQLMTILMIIGMFSLRIIYMIAVYLTKKALIPVENAWKEQAKFIQDASHELRTPIAVVSSKLEGMLRRPDSTINDEAESIAAAMKETRRLKKMVNDLLALTKGDGIVKLNKEEFNLFEMINEITEDYAEIAEFQDKEFIFKTYDEKLEIYTDKAKLNQLILIFIDNAFKYTEEGDIIEVSVSSDDENKISIAISDSGIGIKKEDIPNLFSRFFRSDNVRNRDIDGSGIGLSIASVLANNLEFSIDVKSEYGEGSSFIINMKKNKVKRKKDLN